MRASLVFSKMSALDTTSSSTVYKKEHLRPSGSTERFPPLQVTGPFYHVRTHQSLLGSSWPTSRRAGVSRSPQGLQKPKAVPFIGTGLSTAPMGRNIHARKRLHDFYPQNASEILHIDSSGRRGGYNKLLMSRKCHAKGVTGNARTGGHQESFPGCLCGHTQTDRSLPWSASPCSPHKLLQH